MCSTKTPLTTILRSLFLVLGLSAFGFSPAEADQPERLAVITDTPAGRVLKSETSQFVEILRRILPDFEVETLTADTPIDWNQFDRAVVFQGDLFRQDAVAEEGALFEGSFTEALKQWLEADPKHGALLVGGAAALAENLGYGPVERSLIGGNNDRENAGVIPVRPDAPLFEGLRTDRGTIWLTNAAYPIYAGLRSLHERAVTLAERTGGNSSGLQAIVTDGGEPIAKIFILPWMVGPIYPMAAEDFHANFEGILSGMIHSLGEKIDPVNWTAEPWTLGDLAPLRLAAESVEEADPQLADSFNHRIDALAVRAEEVSDRAAADAWNAEAAALTREILLANPAIDFDDILMIRRQNVAASFPANYSSNSSLGKTGYGNRIERMNLATGQRQVLYQPSGDEFVGDIDLDFDADRILFSMPDLAANRWRIWESRFQEDGSLTPPEALDLIEQEDVDNYDACYLPDGRLIFCSTACFTGVPCVNGSSHVCNLYLKENDGSIRQLTIEQDHDWCPTVMNNGRVMYLRWEYTDLPHCYSRIMFHMNPDGTNQSELYGSGSYWPEAMFYARPIPNDPTKFVAIIGGHHDQPRIGDMVLFDPGISRREAEGAVQKIPGYGKKVQPVICDLPINQVWPKFTHPFPISDTLFLASRQEHAGGAWEIVLLDIYDNVTVLAADESAGLLEPIPLRPTEKPPVIPDRINPSSQTADVFIADVYSGKGLAGVERGTVKSIRLISYQFAYQGMGAEPYSVGLDGPWDPKTILGTVPVNDDGSASFRIPAMMPVAFQMLDADGKAVQLMRSWITAMPGESISCIGCHEDQNQTGAAAPRSVASKSKAIDITPFYGPARGFSFRREIQPILDHYCVECHGAGDALPDLRDGKEHPLQENTLSINTFALFSPSYVNLRSFVRTPTKESQMPTLRPFEFYADSTRLVQLLQNGHHDVQLDKESWDRLLTWIDLNAPFHGNWGDINRASTLSGIEHQYQRRSRLRELYSGVDSAMDEEPMEDLRPEERKFDGPKVSRLCREAATPLDVQASAADGDSLEKQVIPLEGGISIELVTIPGTDFAVQTTEVTNALYRLFDPTYDTGIEFGDFINFSLGELGWPLNRPAQPVARVSWNDAERFCQWLSQKTGEDFTLPTAEQWLLAARAGASQESFDSTLTSADYTLSENLADLSYARINPFGWFDRVNVLPIWRPARLDVDDRARVSLPVGSLRPNDYGLYDMLGNVAEWTRTEALCDDGTVKKTVVGGSWATPADRLAEHRYFAPQVGVYDVGFRVVLRKKEK